VAQRIGRGTHIERLIHVSQYGTRAPKAALALALAFPLVVAGLFIATILERVVN